MLTPLNFFGLLCFCVATIAIFQRFGRHRARSALVAQHGCKSISQYPHKDRWGADLARLRKEAQKEGKFTALYEKHFATYGKTWEENFYGSKVINSVQWENFQEAGTSLVPYLSRAMGANKYAKPFLGKGITTTDGADWKHARDLVTPTFARAELSDISRLVPFVDKLIELIPRDGSTVDMQPLLHRMVRGRAFLTTGSIS